jgi:hypothetical protein
MPLTPNRLTAIALGALAAMTSGSAHAGDTQAVIELFTSQGCSSCPPADKLIASYAGRKDILALSYNVDYWDYLGWKDTLASHDNSQRQRDYSVGRGDGEVYTPQAVIDGRNHATGSQQESIDAILAANRGALSVPIDLSLNTDAVTVHIGAAPNGMPHATLWLVMYDGAVTVPIDRGENSGRTVTYTNVVRKLRPVAMWTGEAMSVDLPRSEMEHAGADHCAVLLQTELKGGLPGPILGAAAISGGL